MMNIDKVRQKGLSRLRDLRDSLRGDLDATVRAVVEEELLAQLAALARLDAAEELLAGKTVDDLLGAAALKLEFDPEELDEASALIEKIEAAREDAAGEALRILNRARPVRVGN